MSVSRQAKSRMRAAPLTARHQKSIEDRLTELDDLHERGVISAEERAAGRAKIIGGDWAAG